MQPRQRGPDGETSGSTAQRYEDKRKRTKEGDSAGDEERETPRKEETMTTGTCACA